MLCVCVCLLFSFINSTTPNASNILHQEHRFLFHVKQVLVYFIFPLFSPSNPRAELKHLNDRRECFSLFVKWENDEAVLCNIAFAVVCFFERPPETHLGLMWKFHASRSDKSNYNFTMSSTMTLLGNIERLIYDWIVDDFVICFCWLGVDVAW